MKSHNYGLDRRNCSPFRPHANTRCRQPSAGSWVHKRQCCLCAVRTLPKKAAGPTQQQPLEPALRKWLQGHGLSEQKVEISDFGDQGRGLRATSKIRKGEQLLRIPRTALLTPQAALQQSRLGSELERGSFPAWSLLAVALAEARFGQQESEWANYAHALPSSSGSVLEWSPAEVELLRGSSLHGTAQEILTAASTSTDELRPIIEKAEADGLLQQGVLSIPHLRWAFSMLLSRLVRLPAWSSAEALVPWADMMNHDCRATSHLDYDPSSGTVCLEACQAYRPGEQVMASYGQKTSGQLLLSYGFAPAAADNPHDACHLRMAIDPEDRLREAKVGALDQYGLKASQDFPLRMGALPQGALQFAAFMDAEPADAAEVTELAGWLFGKGLFPVLDGVDTELLGDEVLLAECKEALAGYLEPTKPVPTSAGAANVFTPAASSKYMRSQQRKALIAAVKLQEQKVLQRAVFVLQQRRKELS